MSLKNLSKWAAAALVLGSSASDAANLVWFGSHGWMKLTSVDWSDANWRISYIREADGGFGNFPNSLTYSCTETSTVLGIDLGGPRNLNYQLNSGNADVDTDVDGTEVDWSWTIKSGFRTLLVIRDPDDKINQLLFKDMLTVTLEDDYNQHIAYVPLEGFDQVVSAFQRDCEELRR